MREFRVSAEGNVNALAAAIAGVFEDDVSQVISLHCIGPRSVNNGVKAVATAKNMMLKEGIKGVVLVVRPEFLTKHIRERDVTAIDLQVRAEHESQTN